MLQINCIKGFGVLFLLEPVHFNNPNTFSPPKTNLSLLQLQNLTSAQSTGALNLKASEQTKQSMGDLKKLSASEISLHTSKDDCWLLINGKVYDVTKFLEDHPGGEEVLLHSSASGDATDAFENVGHSTSAVSMMESYLIGSVEGYVAPYVATGEASSRPASSAQGNKGKPASSASFVDYLLPVLVLIFAFVAWYYLTFISKDEKQ
ncbi:hypothetical protein LUZ61_007255 [Rhynchospora tenuis]|uniref:Cytochrome b5 heme-binding domain-containing protein n=1 Tax=Rhynchospora tenuis TaxID=198213 RepID=A0AAD5ZT55_9POAL|nr:hypothetical protein LUZ61_007255 [Rhynchospora tenuis]